jgi:hypothetical protein
MRRVVQIIAFVAVAGVALPATAEDFTYQPAGDLESGTQGRPTDRIWAPGMRFPVREAPAYANSQVWGHGGSEGPGGSQCDRANYSYPWWDNYCEPRQWDMPMCPGGTGHQGQDIRPQTCDDATYWTVAAEAGTITDDSGTAIKLKTDSGRTHRYLHLEPSSVVVDVGDELQPGDKIGKISNYTGGEYPTTLHLHYDFRQYVQSDPKDGSVIDGTVYVSPYMSLVDAYLRLLGEPGLNERYDAEMQVDITNGTDRYAAGSSEGVPDFFEGETVEAAIYLENASPEVWPTETRLAYWFESPYLEPVSYRIESDHPEYDRETWAQNSADTADENPADGGLGETGDLLMHAFSQGETKRVTVEFEAGPYSIGAAERPAVRAWVRRIEGLYGTQEGYFGEPSESNRFGRIIRDDARVDILSRDHWHFAGDEESEVEGWVGRGSTDRLMRNREDDLLAQKIVGPDAALLSPDWTQMEADRWDELVIRVRSHDGAHRKAVYWAGEGESLTAERRVVFEADGDSEMQTLVVPVGEHPEWSGEVARLRVDLLEGEAPADGDRGWYGLADVFLQSSTRGETNSRRESYVDQSSVELLAVESDGGDESEGDGGAGDVGSGFADVGNDPETSADGGGGASSAGVRSSGCRVASGGGAGGWGWLVVLGLVVGVRRLKIRVGEAADAPR